MNLLPEEGYELMQQLTDYCENRDLHHIEVLIAPPFVHLMEGGKISIGKKLSIAAQNCSDQKSGAYTGEVSIDMIKATGAEAVLIGHSERREYFKEDGHFLNRKIKKALEVNMVPILCVGEKLEERQAGRQKEVVKNQLEGALAGFSADGIENLVIAYEPVWAIGTGETASPQQAQEMHHFIRKYLAKTYHAMLADEVSILYGGSVKPENAKEIFCQPDVDGGLIGGASLRFDDFTAIIDCGVKVLR